jgi:HYR domain/FG-GAP-like repeat/FG-GAP repeat
MKRTITTTIITLNLLLCLLLASATSARGQCATPSFTAAVNFGAGAGPVSVTAGDFNGDGKLDLTTANRNSNNVSVLLGDGAGGFPAAVNFGAGDAPSSVTTGDFNGDGKLDLATANLTSSNVSILLGNGAGSFAAAVNFGAGAGPVSVTAGDFNGDGKLDLATANRNSNNVSVLLGDGAGGFAAAANFGAGNLPLSITTGDFNGDGKLDFATANHFSSNVGVRLGDGAGGFGAAAIFGAISGPTSVTTGDFNGDGKLDFAVANNNSSNVAVRLGDGAGGFAAAVNFSVGAQPQSVVVSDFNGDGKLDLATANLTSNNASILLGNGVGGFASAANFGVGTLPRSVVIGDFNGDGKPDLAVANDSSNNVSVLLNSCMSNTAPTASCQNVTVAANASCTANASINNGSSDPDSGDTITVTQSPAGPYALGTTTVMLTVTDNHGASSSCQATVTVVDTTKPVISCPTNVVVTLPPNTMNTGMVVNYPAPTATDNCSAVPTITTSHGSGSIFPVGVTTVNVTAKDAANNQATCSFTVTVRYNFSGFFQPVDNAPTVNTVNAGQSIPVKFSLSGNKGLNIFAAGYPQSVQIACSSGAPVDAIEETVTAGASSLSYDATTDRYSYVWKSDKAWKGTCRKLVLKFNDGSTREALFQFK